MRRHRYCRVLRVQLSPSGCQRPNQSTYGNSTRRLVAEVMAEVFPTDFYISLFFIITYIGEVVIAGIWRPLLYGFRLRR